MKITALVLSAVPSFIPFAIQESLTNDFSWISVLAFVVILSLFVFIFFLLQKLGKQQRRIEGKFDRKINNLNFEVSNIQQKLNSTRRPQKTHERPIVRKESVKEKPVEPVEVEQPSQEIVLDLPKKESQEQSPENLFYLASPDNEKAFYAPEATATPDKNTLYVIEENTLKLYEKINEQAMRLALNSFELQIKRVCEVVNSKESHHSKIEMLEPGKVIRENNDFKVTQKIKVKFE